VAFSADGVTTYRYQISDMGSELYLDTFCHENGHMLCNWPDLYDYQFDSYGIGRFCLMCDMASATNPVEPCAFLKYAAGWTTTTLLTTHQTDLPLPTRQQSGQNLIYKFEHPTKSNEYFLIENRQKTGRDQALPDSGLALWHIDTDGSNDFEQQTSTEHYKVTLVQADGRWDLEYGNNRGDSTDLWKSPTYVTCGPNSNPNTNWWDGSSSSLGVSQISASGPAMTFTFGSAAIIVTPKLFQHVIGPGTSLPNDTFTLTNPSTLVPVDYTVDSQDFWVYATPDNGTSLGDTHTITIVYDNTLIPTWSPGDFSATLLVNAPEAENNPQIIEVHISVGSVKPDFDYDTDVDQADFGRFQECLSGSGITQTRAECAAMDFDHDHDVDKTDLDLLMGCFRGPDVPADRFCDN
jgi:hypothetical protein